jgi:hypothetical protein
MSVALNLLWPRRGRSLRHITMAYQFELWQFFGSRRPFSYSWATTRPSLTGSSATRRSASLFAQTHDLAIAADAIDVAGPCPYEQGSRGLRADDHLKTAKATLLGGVPRIGNRFGTLPEGPARPR